MKYNMKTNKKDNNKEEVKGEKQLVLKVTAKCSDAFWMGLREKYGKTLLKEYDGYVPAWFPNPESDNDGDYVNLIIDIETGRILNWKQPTATDFKEIGWEI